ncbi:MAG: hypothetical protein QME51_11045 [Planctomycetota bacterium]|nr:hypothetical protein [Planctomycetota bacterium]
MNITIRDGFSIALKILGFYFIYRGFCSLTTIATYLMVWANPSQRMDIESSGITKFAMFAPSVIPFILSIVTAYVLLRFSDRIAEKLVSVDKEIQIFSADNWQKEVFILALRIFGAYQVADKFATLVWQIALAPTYQKAIENDSWQNNVDTLVCIAIGVYLLSGAKHMVNLVFRKKKTEPMSGKPTGESIPST